ncbi:large subunit ribosomal protein L24 [Natronospira proteinivora]|uniref:Large ribosomal subunit protein uL24 n=1 Tax=Natronospira proteinivora TaxID=1807133 RepID=A0ABT1GB12_9GAMM|nr:50S ribosomal protein L24 [Natronospira proteinivora]MCP1728516.1 large subunit ribosomal protein L24 [Natronospira proteinivora]
MNRIKKGDDVIVIAGKDKGRQGTVLRVVDEDHIVVENVNIAKKHQKADPNRGQGGGIIDREMPINISNVMMFNPVTKKGDRVGIRRLEDGRKVRIFKSTNEAVDV